MLPMALNILRVVQFVIVIIVLGTGAYVTSLYTGSFDECFGGDTGCVTYKVKAPGQLGFAIFCSVWSILVIAFLALAPRFLAKISLLSLFMLVLDALTMIFWFAAAISLAVFTGAALGVTGDYQVLQACVAFCFFAWISFLAATVLDGLALAKGGSVGAKNEHSANPELQMGTQHV